MENLIGSAVIDIWTDKNTNLYELGLVGRFFTSFYNNEKEKKTFEITFDLKRKEKFFEWCLQFI